MKVCTIESGQKDFKVMGQINFDTVTRLFNQGVELFNGFEQVELDFTHVSHVDSSAITLLLNWLRFAKQTKKKFIFHNLPGQLLEIANVCEVMPFLENHIYTE
jgi:phospholipid transport system transporter-binding protein